MVRKHSTPNLADQTKPQQRDTKRPRSESHKREVTYIQVDEHIRVMVRSGNMLETLANALWRRTWVATHDGDSEATCSAESGAQEFRHSGGTSTDVRSNVKTVRTARGTGSGKGARSCFDTA